MQESSNNEVTTSQSLHDYHASALALLQDSLHPHVALHFKNFQPNSKLLAIDSSAPQFVRNLQVILNVILLVSRGLALDNSYLGIAINSPRYLNLVSDCVKTLQHFDLKASPETLDLLSLLRDRNKTPFDIFNEKSPVLAKLTEDIGQIVTPENTLALTDVINGVGRYLNQDSLTAKKSNREHLKDIARGTNRQLADALEHKDENQRYALVPAVDGEIITTIKRIGNSLDFLNGALSFKQERIVWGFFEGIASYSEIIDTVCSISPVVISTSAALRKIVHDYVRTINPLFKELMLNALRVEDELFLRPGFLLDEIMPYAKRYFDFTKNIGMELSEDEQNLFLSDRLLRRNKHRERIRKDIAEVKELKSIVNKVKTLLYTSRPISSFDLTDLHYLKNNLPILTLPEPLKSDFEKEIEDAISHLIVGQSRLTIAWGYLKNIAGYDISLQNQVWRALNENYNDIGNYEVDLQNKLAINKHNQLQDLLKEKSKTEEDLLRIQHWIEKLSFSTSPADYLGALLEIRTNIRLVAEDNKRALFMTSVDKMIEDFPILLIGDDEELNKMFFSLCKQIKINRTRLQQNLSIAEIDKYNLNIKAEKDFLRIQHFAEKLSSSTPTEDTLEILLEIRANKRFLGSENTQALFMPSLDKMINSFSDLLKGNDEELNQMLLSLGKQIKIRCALLKQNLNAAEKALDQCFGNPKLTNQNSELALLNQKISNSHLPMAVLFHGVREYCLNNINHYFSETVVTNLKSSNKDGIFTIYSDDPKNIQDIKNFLSALTVLEKLFLNAKNSYLSAAPQALQLKDIASRFHLNAPQQIALWKLIYNQHKSDFTEVLGDLVDQTKSGLRIKSLPINTTPDPSNFFTIYDKIFGYSEYAFDFLNVGTKPDEDAVDLSPFIEQMIIIENNIFEFLSGYFEDDITQIFRRNDKGVYEINEGDTPLEHTAKSLLNALHQATLVTNNVNTYLFGRFWKMIAVLKSVSLFVGTLNSIDLGAAHPQIAALRNKLLLAAQNAVDQQINPILLSMLKQLDSVEQSIGLRQGVLTKYLEAAIDVYQTQCVNLSIHVSDRDDNAFLGARDEERNHPSLDRESTLKALQSDKDQAEKDLLLIQHWIEQLSFSTSPADYLGALLEIRNNIRLVAEDNKQALFMTSVDKMIEDFPILLTGDDDELNKMFFSLCKQIKINRTRLQQNLSIAEIKLDQFEKDSSDQFNADTDHRLNIINDHQKELERKDKLAENAIALAKKVKKLEKNAHNVLNKGNEDGDLALAEFYHNSAVASIKEAQALAAESGHGEAKRIVAETQNFVDHIGRDLHLGRNPPSPPKIKKQNIFVAFFVSILRTICDVLDSFILLFRRPQPKNTADTMPAKPADPVSDSTISEQDNVVIKKVPEPVFARRQKFSRSVEASYSNGFFGAESVHTDLPTDTFSSHSDTESDPESKRSSEWDSNDEGEQRTLEWSGASKGEQRTLEWSGASKEQQRTLEWSGANKGQQRTFEWSGASKGQQRTLEWNGANKGQQRTFEWSGANKGQQGTLELSGNVMGLKKPLKFGSPDDESQGTSNLSSEDEARPLTPNQG